MPALYRLAVKNLERDSAAIRGKKCSFQLFISKTGTADFADTMEQIAGKHLAEFRTTKPIKKYFRAVFILGRQGIRCSKWIGKKTIASEG